MALAFLIIGVIAAGIYHAVTDNSYNPKQSGAALIWGVLIVGVVLEAIMGPTIGLLILIVLFAGWVFS